MRHQCALIVGSTLGCPWHTAASLDMAPIVSDVDVTLPSYIVKALESPMRIEPL